MNDFLATTLFRFGIFPFGSTVLGVAVKWATRNDQYSSFAKEDFAVGLDLIRTAALMFVVLTSDRAISLQIASTRLARVSAKVPIDTAALADAQKQVAMLAAHSAAAGWYIAFFVLALWGVSTLVRKLGWKSASELRVIPGIAVPLGVGVLALVIVMADANS
jgi:hypothetical protein